MFDDIKYFEVKAETVDNLESERALIHYISTPHLDRGGDVVNPHGMIDTDFKKSPTVFYNHDYTIPVGKSLWRKKRDEGVMAKTIFGKTDFANDIYLLHKDGIINTWSIGWRPEIKDGRIAPKAISFDEGTNTTYVNSWELLEYSSAPLPMNPHALDQIKGMVKSATMSNYIQTIEDKAKVDMVLKGYEDKVKEIADLQKQLDSLIGLADRLDGLEKDILDLTKLIRNEKSVLKTETSKSVEISAEALSKLFLERIGGEISRITRKNLS